MQPLHTVIGGFEEIIGYRISWRNAPRAGPQTGVSANRVSVLDSRYVLGTYSAFDGRPGWLVFDGTCIPLGQIQDLEVEGYYVATDFSFDLFENLTS